MAQRFTRKELYDLVWSEPMKTLAARYSISDVALSKACRRSSIPVPERGYWAKLKAGKKILRRPLPPRGPGMFDEVIVGAKNNWAYRHTLSDREVLEAALSPPVFDRDIEEVEAQVRAGVRRVTVPKTMQRPHRLIAKLLTADEERRRKAASERFVLSWDQPQFDSPFERRRLRLLNAIFTALERYGMKPWVRGRPARELGVQVNDQNVSFSVDDANAKLFPHPSYYEPCKNPSGRMKVAIASWRPANNIRQAWQDKKTDLVEKSVTDIVVALILAGERQYRETAQHSYEWRAERKAQLIEDIRRRKEEEDRKERERLARLEKERVDRLLADADDLRKARDIRAYVQEVRALCASGSQQLNGETFRAWEQWALTQADRIDPVVSGRFRESMKETGE